MGNTVNGRDGPLQTVKLHRVATNATKIVPRTSEELQGLPQEFYPRGRHSWGYQSEPQDGILKMKAYCS